MKRIFLTVLLLMYSMVVFAVDPSIMFGKWEDKTKLVLLDIQAKDRCTLVVGGKKVKVENMELLWSEASSFPFLVVAGHLGESEVTVSLVYGEDRPDSASLRGFLEKLMILPGGHGDIDVKSYAVSLTAVK